MSGYGRPGTLSTLAPAKINVCLFLGPTRADGRHELVTVMQAVSLADRVTMAPAPGDADEVLCPGVDGENLGAAALAEFRAQTGWGASPVRIEIEKNIPVAAGMAGGSADAGAVLRLAAHAAGGVDHAQLLSIAARIGADVASQVHPGRVLATGAGEVVEALPALDAYGVLVLPAAGGLATPAVYAEADRLELPGAAPALAGRLAAVRGALPDLPDGLVVNELEPAARSLHPQIDGVLAAARGAGADIALVSGSGPTVLGLFNHPAGAARAAQALAGRSPAPIACRTVAADFAVVTAA